MHPIPASPRPSRHSLPAALLLVTSTLLSNRTACSQAAQDLVPHWRQLTTANAPPARMGHAMAHDALRDRTVLFGGFNDHWGSPHFGFLADTWEFDGFTWQQIS